MFLGNEFFKRDTLELTRDLLGKTLCVKDIETGGVIRGTINETEAYHGYEDDASHGHKKKTPRNTVMYETVGHAYVYFTYGMHFMLNLTSFQKDFPSAVLIRSVLIPEDNGIRDLMSLNRFKKSFEELSSYQKKNLTNGPGKVTAAFKIDKRLSGLELNEESGIWVEDSGFIVPKESVKVTPRIGIDYAQNAKDWLWRFCF
jgi:DNA-3-methyladenine glycosylase